MNVQLNDFKFWGNTWTVDTTSRKFSDEPTRHMYVIDSSTGRKYLNQAEGDLRVKSFFLLCPLSIAGHAVSLPINAIYRLFLVCTFYDLWKSPEKGKPCNFVARLQDLGANFLRIIIWPIALVGLVFACLLIYFSPRNGAKLYNSIERLMYNDHYAWAPCLSPEATSHGLGGDITNSKAH